MLRERAKAGMAQARRSGKHIGRPAPRKFHADEIGRMRLLRSQGMSIRKLALDFDTTQWMAGRLNAQNAEQPELARADLVEAIPADQGAVSVAATKAVSPLLGAASYRRAVKQLLTSVVREICTLRSVGAGARATASGHPVGAEQSASLPRPTIRPESSHLPRTRTSHLCFSWHFRGPIRRGQTRDSTRVAVRPAPSTPKQNLCPCRRDVRGVFF